MEQDQLVRQLQSQSKAAFTYLYDHYAGAINGIITRIVSDDDVAAELLQDVFLKYWNKIGQFDSKKGRLFTWMANIARNQSIDYLRSKNQKKANKTESIDFYVSTVESANATTTSIDAIGIRKCLESLRKEEYFVLDLTYFKGYTQAEIAEEFDIPLGTVKTRLRMALKQLREELKEK